MTPGSGAVVANPSWVVYIQAGRHLATFEATKSTIETSEEQLQHWYWLLMHVWMNQNRLKQSRFGARGSKCITRLRVCTLPIGHHIIADRFIYFRKIYFISSFHSQISPNFLYEILMPMSPCTFLGRHVSELIFYVGGFIVHKYHPLTSVARFPLFMRSMCS